MAWTLPPISTLSCHLLSNSRIPLIFFYNCGLWLILLSTIFRIVIFGNFSILIYVGLLFPRLLEFNDLSSILLSYNYEEERDNQWDLARSSLDS